MHTQRERERDSNDEMANSFGYTRLNAMIRIAYQSPRDAGSSQQQPGRSLNNTLRYAGQRCVVFLKPHSCQLLVVCVLFLSSPLFSLLFLIIIVIIIAVSFLFPDFDAIFFSLSLSPLLLLFFLFFYFLNSHRLIYKCELDFWFDTRTQSASHPRREKGIHRRTRHSLQSNV